MIAFLGRVRELLTNPEKASTSILFEENVERVLCICFSITHTHYQIMIVGYIHGNLQAFNSIIEKRNELDCKNILFLGDSVDRGIQGIEVLLSLFQLKYWAWKLFFYKIPLILLTTNYLNLFLLKRIHLQLFQKIRRSLVFRVFISPYKWGNQVVYKPMCPKPDAKRKKKSGFHSFSEEF